MDLIQTARPVIQQPNLTQVMAVLASTIETVPGRQGISLRKGVGAETCGTQNLCMNVATIPAGHREEAHWHVGSESALLILPGSGKTITYWGDELQYAVEAEEGDLLYFPAGVRHLGVNLSGRDASAVVARNDNLDQLRVETFPIPPHLADVATMPTVHQVKDLPR